MAAQTPAPEAESDLKSKTESTAPAAAAKVAAPEVPEAAAPAPPASEGEDPVAKFIAAKAGEPKEPASNAPQTGAKASAGTKTPPEMPPETPPETPWSKALAASVDTTAASKPADDTETAAGPAVPETEKPAAAKFEAEGPDAEEVLVLGKPKQPASGPVDIHVGQKLRQRRWMIGMSRQQLGDAVGVSLDEIRGYEMGTSHIDAERMWQIASALDVPMSYFFEDLEGQSENGDSARSTVLSEAEARKMMEGGASGPPRAVEAS